MGSLASSLCCSSETSHESDGIQKQTPQNMPTAKSSQDAKRVLRKAQETSTSISKSGQKTHLDSTNNKSKPAKGVAEDDNSVNESDTLSVTNEEAKQLDNKTEENSKDENMTGESGASKIDISQNAASEEIARMHENGVSQQNGITQSNGVTQKNESENDNDNEFGNSNEDNHFEKDSAIDVRSTFDLSAIQENQSFNPETGYLLGKKDVSRFGNKKCLVLDLDETLVHSSFKYIRTADFVIPVEIEDQVHHVYVIKRPGVDEFLRRVGQWYEVVVFTASVAKYGDPLLNKLDVHHAVHQRLFRDSCYSYQGNFIKNLSQLGRPLAESIIIDNSPASYIFHPQHSVPISSWFSDTHDNELLDLLPLLKDLSKPNVDDVSLVLDTTM